jgi:chromosome segregation ATPase
MKITTLLIAALFIHLHGTAQITQDSINKLQAEINKSQQEINKRQREVNTLQKSLGVDTGVRDESENLIKNILDDLMEMKIISNKDVVAFSISSDEMRVNNKKQPDAVLEKFRAKYHVGKSYSIVHAKSMGSTSTSITK